MKVLSIAALTLVLGLGGSAAFLHAQSTPGDAPETKKPAKAMKIPRLTQPWSKMGSLTPEQKVKIGEIHKATLAEKKKLDEKEEADIMGLLTDEQKGEVTKLKEDTGAARRKGPAEPAEPTTKPDAM